MADNSLHIDTDWKKQAQEEKRKLAEQAQAKAPAPMAAATPRSSGAAAPSAPTAARGQRELPPASFATLVQTIVTQALYYLGDLSPRGGESAVNLDLAKHQIDLLGVLEEKAKGNLNVDEQKLLDAALYESRMRYVSVASQYIN